MHLSSIVMLPRLTWFVRVVLMVAGTSSSLPSIEGAVLCLCGDAGLVIEAGTVRCTDAPNDGVPLDAQEHAAIVADADHCGACVDVPLGTSSLAVQNGSSRPQPLLHPLAVAVQAQVHVPAIAASLQASFGASSRRPIHSSGVSTTPLRC